jgi:dihydrofolate reductase
VAVAGGVNVINQYLAAGLIDELWLHIAPVTIGSGQRLFKDTPVCDQKVANMQPKGCINYLSVFYLYVLLMSL